MHILIAALHRPEKPTGVCRYAVNLAQCLTSTETVSQVTLVIGKWQKYYFESSFTLNSEKIKLVDIDIPNNSITRNLWFLFALPRLVRELRPTLVHLSFPLPFLRSQFPCPVVSTIHDLYPYQFPENFGYRQVLFNRLFLQLCIRNSDALTCVSHTTLDSLIYYFPEVHNHKKTAITYNTVNFSQVEAKPPRDLQYRLNGSFILCVGQHRKNKNLDLLIISYAVLIREKQLNAGTKLVIVGSSGPETENLLRLIQEHALTDSVVMLSGIDDDELCWLYQNCTLFVIPSSLEGFCIPLVEALFFSCKVICSNIPIFREIGSSSCTYFDLAGDTVKNLTQSMLQSLASEVSGETDIHLRFSNTEIARQCLQFYSELT